MNECRQIACACAPMMWFFLHRNLCVCPVCLRWWCWWCRACDDDCNCDRDYYFDCIVSHECVRCSVWNVCFSACEVLSSDCIPVLFLQPCSFWITCYFGESSQFIAMSWISVALLQLLTFAIGMLFFQNVFLKSHVFFCWIESWKYVCICYACEQPCLVYRQWWWRLQS